MPDETPSLIAERYRLDELIERGPVSEVWRGHDLRADWPVAVKILSAGSDTGTRERFAAQARAMAQIVHPNVVTVFDIGDQDGRPYLVMELLTGATLAAERGPLEIAAICDLMGRVAAGLDAGHRSGVVHGNLKPEDLRRAGGGGLKIVGFGLPSQPSIDQDEASTESATETPDGSVTAEEGSGEPAPESAGSPPEAEGAARPNTESVNSATDVTPYRAPEQIDGGQATAASDLYALGCICYELLCAQPPFSGPDLAQQHLQRSPTWPSQHRSDIPDDLERLVLALLAKDPAARPASAMHVRHALAAVNRPAETRPQPTVGNEPAEVTGARHGHDASLGGAMAGAFGHGAPSGPQHGTPHGPGSQSGSNMAYGQHGSPSGPQGPGGQSGHGQGGPSGSPQGPSGQSGPGQGGSPSSPYADQTHPQPAYAQQGPRAGDTAIYDATTDGPPPSDGAGGRRLVIQAVVAVLVIVAVTIALMLLSNRSKQAAAPTPSSAPTVISSPTQPQESPTPTETPTETPTPTPTQTDSDPELSRTPPGGWQNWLRQLDSSLLSQEQMNGIDPGVARKAHERIREAGRDLVEGSAKDAHREIGKVMRDLDKARGREQMSQQGPLIDFLDGKPGEFAR